MIVPRSDPLTPGRDVVTTWPAAGNGAGLFVGERMARMTACVALNTTHQSNAMCRRSAGKNWKDRSAL